jgi:hypothetical protein
MAMDPGSGEGGRNLLAYGLFVVVVLALVIAPVLLYLQAMSVVDIVWRTAITVIVVAVIAFAIFYVYEKVIRKERS